MIVTLKTEYSVHELLDKKHVFKVRREMRNENRHYDSIQQRLCNVGTSQPSIKMTEIKLKVPFMPQISPNLKD